MECLLGKAVGNEQSQPRKGHLVFVQQGHGEGLPKLFGAHIMSPHAPESGHQDTGFSVCLTGFWSCFAPIPAFYTPVLPFWNGYACSVPLYVRIMKCVFDSAWAHS
jgi:hypothetical protein